MRDISQPLASHLAGGVTTLCHCWRLTRGDGVVIGFTDHDHDISFDDVTHAAASGLTPTEAEEQLGMAVATGEVSGVLTDLRIREADIAAGLYDDAEVQGWLVNWADPEQRLLLDVASVGEIRRNDGAFVAELRGPMHRYDQEQGRSYQATCTADLGDGQCGLALATWTVAGTVDEGIGRLSVRIADVAGHDAGHFIHGTLRVLSGPNAGQSRSIKDHAAGGLITVWESFGVPLAPGDAVSLLAGCDKSFETCRLKFANSVNFRGFPHIPTPDFILTYARSGEGGHDGGRLDP